MATNRHPPQGPAFRDVGPMIGIMLVGLLLSVAVTFSGTRVEAPTDAMSGTVEVIRAGESRGHIAPAIAGVDRAITTDA